MESTVTELESLATRLERSGRYRVLRRIEPRPFIEPADGTPTRLGLFVDVETTGLDPAREEIIELAMVPFTFSEDGRIFEVRPAFQSYHQPSRPIPAEITALTGITDAMVAGHRIDPAAVKAFAAPAELIVAHNAGFDRRFTEKLSDVFVGKPWACSLNQVDWDAEGFEGKKLGYLVAGAGFFYDRHRAVNDCLAAIELLAAPLPRSGGRAMRQLLDACARPSWRIWAEGSPFELKDVLKARGYRWNGDGIPRAWYIDVEDDAREGELRFLREEIYRRDFDPPARRITALERFSVRGV